jgi:hypothetical protein
MRGQDEQQLGVFSYVSPEQRIPHNHPLAKRTERAQPVRLAPGSMSVSFTNLTDFTTDTRRAPRRRLESLTFNGRNPRRKSKARIE